MADEDIGEPGRRNPFSSLRNKPGELILDAVDRGVNTRWEPAQRRAATYASHDLDESLKHLRRSFRRELGVTGAAAGGVAAMPGSVVPGVSAGIAEIGWSTIRLADLILITAAIHGHERTSVEERRAWVLAVLAYGEGAAATFTKLATEVAKGTGGKATKAIPNSALQSINRTIGRTIVTKYGTKRGAIAIGRLLPLGIGAGIGFGLNALLVEQVARNADSFFQQLPTATTQVAAAPEQ